MEIMHRSQVDELSRVRRKLLRWQGQIHLVENRSLLTDPAVMLGIINGIASSASELR